MLFYLFIALFVFSAIFCRSKKMFKIVYTLNTIIIIFFLYTLSECLYDYYIKPDAGYVFAFVWLMGLFVLFATLRSWLDIDKWDKIIPFISALCIFIWSMDAISNGITRLVGNIVIGVISVIVMLYFYVKTLKGNKKEHK